MTQYQPPQTWQPQPVQGSGMAITAFVLALCGLIFCGPLAVVGLILGIIALNKGTGSRGLAIASICIAPVALLWMVVMIGIFLPALGKARQAAQQIKSSTQLRMIGQALAIYAQNNRDHFPEAGADWKARLISNGSVSAEMFEAPGAAPGQESYFYNPAAKSMNATSILVYENPDLWRGRGMNVVFGDNHVEWVAGDQYRRLIQTLPAQPQR